MVLSDLIQKTDETLGRSADKSENLKIKRKNIKNNKIKDIKN